MFLLKSIDDFLSPYQSGDKKPENKYENAL
jgi:hypothetical protein